MFWMECLDLPSFSLRHPCKDQEKRLVPFTCSGQKWGIEHIHILTYLSLNIRNFMHPWRKATLQSWDGFGLSCKTTFHSIYFKNWNGFLKWRKVLVFFQNELTVQLKSCSTMVKKINCSPFFFFFSLEKVFSGVKKPKQKQDKSVWNKKGQREQLTCNSDNKDLLY